MPRSNDEIVLPGSSKYFEGPQYDDDLIYNNSLYNFNDLDELMRIRNITIEKGDLIQTETQVHIDDEGLFLGVLPDDTLYVSWDMYFKKKLFVRPNEVTCVKKTNKHNQVVEIWKRRRTTSDFVLVRDMY